MSILTTSEQLVFPAEGAGITLVGGDVAWQNPADWTFLFTTTASTVIAAPQLLNDAAFSWANLTMEVAIGTGLEGAVEEVGYFGLHSPNSGIGGPTQGPEPNTPIGTIAAGTDLWARLRASGGFASAAFAFKYYENYDGDIAEIGDVTLGMLPASEGLISIEPDATPNAPSDWAVLSDELESDLDVVALIMNTPEPDVDVRWELGTGADGAETHIDTFASASRGANGGRSWYAERPGYLPLLQGQRVVMRVRVSAAASEPYRAALMVFRHEPSAGEGVIGPLLTITMSYRPPVV